jgi:hypothetical protein
MRPDHAVAHRSIPGGSPSSVARVRARRWLASILRKVGAALFFGWAWLQPRQTSPLGHVTPWGGRRGGCPCRAWSSTDPSDLTGRVHKGNWYHADSAVPDGAVAADPFPGWIPDPGEVALAHGRRGAPDGHTERLEWTIDSYGAARSPGGTRGLIRLRRAARRLHAGPEAMPPSTLMIAPVVNDEASVAR